jgi:sialate O-acetylesterase
VQGHSIVLDASGIPANRVRFCWGDAPICNLYDSSGLPVGPFEFPIT